MDTLGIMDSTKIDDEDSRLRYNFTLGGRLRYIRKERKISKEQLGLSCGFSKMAAEKKIKQFEANKVIPKEDIIKRLTEKLNISPLMLTMKTNEIEQSVFANVLWGDIIGALDGFETLQSLNFKKYGDDLRLWYEEFHDEVNSLSEERKMKNNRKYRDWMFSWEPDF